MHLRNTGYYRRCITTSHNCYLTPAFFPHKQRILTNSTQEICITFTMTQSSGLVTFINIMLTLVGSAVIWAMETRLKFTDGVGAVGGRYEDGCLGGLEGDIEDLEEADNFSC
ncbi:predicted protein [Sclerotinia sclerotiorum 1980 UF-70]|uniref:Uncharacterized protein n=1 Tax=Sclerotinia sclerotiorum (strain ATCC 18683 / 1980 / Ss-1) TaxID=665079 RepID=A7F9J4_SCLS1|nr:predicted protein [Sclerotinia sclerotiorum 1980 UF-70]EDO00405.1 predicted protein [Sclerotinia sclerotiorum 1980 UF-70]